MGSAWKNISCYFSFDENDFGLFDADDCDKIKYYIKNGFTNKAILSALDIQYEEYFDDILNKMRTIFK